jgi:ATPase subunit of ABC transporter with duplicated ATPase domains
MNWDQIVPALFSGNGSFACHGADEKRAFEWLTDLRKRGIGWAEVERQLRMYMGSTGLPQDHIEREIERASEGMKYWLSD